MQRLHGRSDVLIRFNVCYHVAKSILDELETTEFSLGLTQIKRATIIQFRINKCCGYRGCRFFQINIRSLDLLVNS